MAKRAKGTFRKGKTPKAPSSPIRRDLDTLIQGVSQQPAHLRLTGQGTSQVNGWSSPVEGLSKRNCMRLIARIQTSVLTDFYLEMMDIIQGEQYSVFVRPEDATTTLIDLRRNATIPTIDLHGTGMTVNGDGIIECDNSSYLHNAPGNFYKKYVLIGTGNLGLLLNREVDTAMETTTSPEQTGKGIVFVRAVAYNVTYTVSIDGTQVATFTTPAIDDDPNEISTSTVATQLTTAINGTAGYTATRKQYVIYIEKDDNTDFELEVDDGRSNELANGFTDTVNTLAELPVIAPNDYRVTVESDPTTTLDDQYLKFRTAGTGSFGQGAWSEDVEQGIAYQIDKDTMPIVLWRAAQDVFFVGPADGATRTQAVGGTNYSYTFPTWANRTSGTETTNPDPEFIGQKIKDHLIFRSRYVVCAGESVSFSETDDAFNFFNDSSIATQATDPFGLRGTSERSSPMEWMIPVEDSILAFSQTSQFQVRAADGEVLTPVTGEIFRLSNIEMNANVRPRLAGNQVIFATEYFGYTHFREFNFANQGRTRLGLNLGSSADITNYVPKYIEGLITHWDVGPAVDCAVAISPTDDTEVYVYKYLWKVTETGQQAVQKSWSKWKFNQSVKWVKFMNNALYLLVTDASNTYFCVQLNDETEVRDEPQIHLDRLIQEPAPAFAPATARVTETYDAGTNTTTFTLPYAAGATGAKAVTRFNNADNQGLLLGECAAGVSQIVCTESGDWTGYNISFGEPYEFEYIFNTAYVSDTNQSQTTRIGQLAGRTQILRWTVNHVDTGYYQIRVKRQNRPTTDTVKTFMARRLDVDNNTLSESDRWVETGDMSVPVASKNDKCEVTVESDSWLPLTVTSASWQGVYSDIDKAMK